MRQRFHLQADADELSRPQLIGCIGKLRFQFHGPCRRIDLIIDALQRTAIDNRFSVIAEHVDRKRPLGDRSVDANDLLLRQAELHGDWLQLRDDHKARRIGGMNDIALVDLTKPGPPGKRRDDLRIAERGLCIVDRGLIGSYLRLELRDQRTLRIGLLLRSRIRGCQLLIAGKIDARVGQLRLILRLLGSRLIELCLIDDRIDFGEHIALLDVLSLDKIHGDQLAVDLRAHCDRIQRPNRADPIEIDRDILNARRCRQHRHGQIRPNLILRPLLRIRVPGNVAETAEDQEHDDDGYEPASGMRRHNLNLLTRGLRRLFCIRLKEH